MTLTSISSLKSSLNTRGIKLQTKIISSIRGERVKGNRKKHRLLFQITAIVLPLFALMTAAVIYIVYSSTVNGFLEAQNSHIKKFVNSDYALFSFIDQDADPRIPEWYLDQTAKADFDYTTELTEEERKPLDEYEKVKGSYTEYSWFEQMPDDIRKLFLRSYYITVKTSLTNYFSNSDIEDVFLMDMSEENLGLVLYDYNIYGYGKKIGDRFDLDLSDHPELKKLKEENGKDFVFEKASDFPHEGNYYIGYKPVMIDGKLRAVIGVTYRWDDFRRSLTGTIHKALLIIICGIGIVMTVLLIFLYRKAIKPVKLIQSGLMEYSADREPKEVVSNMYKIKENNELGYLADVISDFTLEIDHYTKENIRIAGERERAEKELYEAELQIMVSQIRPHFLYNALTSIAMMCELDPKTAKEATIAFSKYLRGNMDSLKQTKAVPFEQELSHLKNYLYIEKLRFDDLLNIEYDIQATKFELPMLSIQPIVENAVKHGVGMAEDGGTITIATRETDDAYEVIVSDDGVGFDVNAPRKDDGRSHIGMENTKKRLKEMCDADMIITSKVGEGTTARVIIPKKRRNENENTVS